MAKFYGIVGYGESVEEPEGSGIFVDLITEVFYYGEVRKNTRKLDSNEDLNDDISVVNTISILADEYANEHFFAIKFVEWAGVAWTVTSVDAQRPRLLLTLGKVYNGPRAVEEP